MADAIAQRGVMDLPGLRQLILLVGLAGAIAAGLWLVFWSQGQNYATLYSQLSERETAQVVDALQSAGIPHKLDGPSGTVTVPEPQLRDARMRLAAQGLPQSDALGVEMIQKDTGFGTSQFMETARYQLAIETELARTIVKVQGVQSARVHLAVPRPSAFVREQRHATASVLLQLYSGRHLEPGHVAGIVHLVASSVPDLEAGDVTVIDQNGTLLSSPDGNDALAVSGKQLEYTRSLEQDYALRVEKILTPIVGEGRVRAGVTAVLDFTQTEESSENFDPAKQVVRSEQNANDQRMQGDIALGIPGALSNQPPATTPAPPAPKQQAAVTGTATPPPQPVATSTRSTKNYEMDRKITHRRPSTGDIKRLSVAVLVDNKVAAGGDGKTTEPVSKEDLDRYTALVKEAIGFDEQRGDKVEVINASFSPPVAAGDVVPAEPWYANPMLKQIGRQGVAVLLVLALVIVVLRPIMKNLLQPGQGRLAGSLAGPAGDLARDKVTLSGGAAPLPNYEAQVAAARSLVTQDPKRAAQVVKEWVSTDGR